MLQLGRTRACTMFKATCSSWGEHGNVQCLRLHAPAGKNHTSVSPAAIARKPHSRTCLQPTIGPRGEVQVAVLDVGREVSHHQFTGAFDDEGVQPADGAIGVHRKREVLLQLVLAHISSNPATVRTHSVYDLNKDTFSACLHQGQTQFMPSTGTHSVHALKGGTLSV